MVEVLAESSRIGAQLLSWTGTESALGRKETPEIVQSNSTPFRSLLNCTHLGIMKPNRL